MLKSKNSVQKGIDIKDYKKAIDKTVNLLIDKYKVHYQFSQDQLEFPIISLRSQFEVIFQPSFTFSIKQQLAAIDTIREINSVAKSKDDGEEVAQRLEIISEKFSGLTTASCFCDIYAIRTAEEERMRYFGRNLFPQNKTQNYLSYIKDMSKECIPLMCDFITDKLRKMKQSPLQEHRTNIDKQDRGIGDGARR